MEATTITPYRLADEPPSWYAPSVLFVYGFVCIFECIVAVVLFHDARPETMFLAVCLMTIVWMPWVVLCAQGCRVSMGDHRYP